jgi:MSHA biogenesis protein MshG
MPVYQYKGRTGKGDAVSGRLEADTPDAAASQLLNTGITPNDINEAPARQADLNFVLFRPRPSLDDIILFSRQMYSLTKSGVPLIRGLRGLAESTRNELLREAIREVVEDLESGRDLSSSLARHASIFGPLYINIIRVGESSGNLEDAFERLARHYSVERDTRRRVKRAMMYPVFVLLAITLAIGVITVFVIPTFAGIFDRFDAELPWATQAILVVSGFMEAYWLHLLAAGALAFAVFRYWSRTDNGRRRWDRVKLGIPAVGSILERATMARFARAFAVSFRAGVPLVQAMTLVSRAVDNAWIGERIAGMRDGIERGESLQRSAAAAGIFTPLINQMIQEGEETGKVDDMLDEVAEFYEREVDYDLENLSSVIEPVLIVAVGALVLILALGVFLPLWDLARVAF